MKRNQRTCKETYMHETKPTNEKDLQGKSENESKKYKYTCVCIHIYTHIYVYIYESIYINKQMPAANMIENLSSNSKEALFLSWSPKGFIRH